MVDIILKISIIQGKKMKMLGVRLTFVLGTSCMADFYYNHYTVAFTYNLGPLFKLIFPITLSLKILNSMSTIRITEFAYLKPMLDKHYS